MRANWLEHMPNKPSRTIHRMLLQWSLVTLCLFTLSTSQTQNPLSANTSLSVSLCLSLSFIKGEAPEPECVESSVRLAGGLNDNGGRVEVCYEGVWGSVCDHGFGDTEAQVTCSQLGFRNCEGISPFIISTTVMFWYSGSTVIHTPLFGSGMGPIQLDDVRCQGNEKALLNCAHREMRQHNCYRSNEVAVACRASEHKTTSVVFIS